ncbi:Protein RTM1 OS=Saccharomyces cerevisiae GN=RTM1 PE=3 SV=1 [Rhizoctonia solani AG-1 IB]|uniref:Protein RTM1 n=1 Tax=Thanatephorus cucumeris (strain AG1-IB / isolate 7/3/14) TaxID=1108050 RepID=A0A0B7F9K1_THACB|nr:Protein RTM1 OS=Saccharomyces cerevisiae GN=RTM1 PE=3 SV=1 [Rhizoctonia solani AG-1 IB]
MSSSTSLLIAGLLAQCVLVFGQDTEEPKPPRSPILLYTPSKGWAVVMGSLYALTALASIMWFFRHRGRYMFAIIIGAGFYSIGLFLRIMYAGDPTNVGKYAVMNLIILLSPCGFIAGVYMLLSRLAYHLDAADLLAINARKLTKIFVISDVVTFWIQATGGGLTATQNPSTRNLGSKVFLGGLVAQLISFLIYSFIFALFIHRVHKHRKQEWEHRPQGLRNHWLALVWTMAVSCVFIIIRSVYRAVESAQGREGQLATHELYFYILDTIVLWIAVTYVLVVNPKDDF